MFETQIFPRLEKRDRNQYFIPRDLTPRFETEIYLKILQKFLTFRQINYPKSYYASH